MRLLRRLSSGVDALNDRIGASIRWLVLLMVLTGAGNAVVRYFSRGLGLSLNLVPVTEAQWYLFSIVFLLGAAYALRHGVHVRVDVLYERLTTRTRAWIDLVGTVLFLVPFAVMMLWVTFPAVRSSWEIREASPDPGGLPRYPVKALILVAFALLVLQALSEVVKQVDILLGGRPDTAADPPEPEAHL
ncbi:MAG: TRAP transporter small permease subunit [Gemmatimonadota bacterium]|jgi:TRAP-type mannitol/chloroaromatic compound transport system permease small subunit